MTKRQTKQTYPNKPQTKQPQHHTPLQQITNNPRSKKYSKFQNIIHQHEHNLTIKNTKTKTPNNDLQKPQTPYQKIKKLNIHKSPNSTSPKSLRNQFGAKKPFPHIHILTLIALLLTTLHSTHAQAPTSITPDILSQLQIEKIALLRSQQSSCGLFNQFLSPKPIMSNQRAHYQGSMGQVQRSSEITLSFWASLDVRSFEQVYGKEVKSTGRSGKISLFKIVNPNKPMVISKSGGLLFPDHPPCPVSKKELLTNPQFLEFENVRNNPNCFTNGIYEGAKQFGAKESLRVLQDQAAAFNTFPSPANQPDSPFTTKPNNPTGANQLLESKKPDSKKETATTSTNNNQNAETPKNKPSNAQNSETPLPPTQTQNQNQTQTPNKNPKKKPKSSLTHSMHKLIEISVIYKGSQTELIPNQKGVKLPMTVWLFDIQIEFPSKREKSGAINFEIETLSDQKFTPGNQIFVALSLDFSGNRGKLYIKDFDDYNTIDKDIDLFINTNGEVFLNKGFEIVTGDAHRPESALVYTDHSKNVIHFFKGKKGDNLTVQQIGRIYNLNTNFLYFPRVKNMIFFEFENNDLLDKGIVLETFFDVKFKDAKSIDQISKNEKISVDNPNPGLFYPFKKDMNVIHQIRHVKNYFDSLESKGRIQKKLNIKGTPIMVKNAQNGIIFNLDNRLNLGKLRVSQADLIKSPSFFFRMKISDNFHEQMKLQSNLKKSKSPQNNISSFEIMRIKDDSNKSELICLIETLDQNEGDRYQEYLRYVTKTFLDNHDLGYYNPYEDLTEKQDDKKESDSKKNKAGQENPDYQDNLIKKPTKTNPENTAKTTQAQTANSGLNDTTSPTNHKLAKQTKQLKPDKLIAQEKAALAAQFLRVKLIFTDSKTSKTELISMPFIKPGKPFEFMFSFVILPRNNKHFVFFNKHLGFDSIRSLDKAKFQYDQASYLMFDNRTKNNDTGVKLMNEVKTVPITGNNDKMEVKVELEGSGGEKGTKEGTKKGTQEGTTEGTKDTTKGDTKSSNGTVTQSGDKGPVNDKGASVKGTNDGSKDSGKEGQAPVLNEVQTETKDKNDKKSPNVPVATDGQTKTDEKKPEDSQPADANTKQNEPKEVTVTPKDATEGTTNADASNKDTNVETTPTQPINTTPEPKPNTTQTPKPTETTNEPASEIKNPESENPTPTPTNETPKPTPNSNLPAPQPTTQPAPQLNTQPAPQPNTQPAPQPNTQPAPQPNTQPTPQPTTQPVPQPTTQPTPQPIDVLKDSLTDQSNQIINNTNNSIDVDKLEQDGKLNPNPIIINPDGSETINNSNPQANAPGSRLLQSKTVSEVAPETEIKAEPKETPNTKTNETTVRINTTQDENTLPHIVAYHFAIVENFYGAIFNSQGAKSHDFSHSTSLEFFRKHYPKIPENTLKEALAAEASSLLTPDKKDLPTKIHDKIMKYNPKVVGCESRCSIPLGESLASNSCLGCTQGVLDYKTHQCLQFCPTDLKNAGGICVPCMSDACEERPKVKIFIDRYQEDRFRISISDKLSGMDQSNLNKLMKVEIKGVKPSFYEYEILPTSNTTADLELKIKETLYNKTLRVYLDPEMVKSRPLYDSNRNGVEAMETDLHIGTIAYLKSSERRWVDVFSIILAVLFFAALAMLLFFGIWSCFKPRALVDQCLKRIVRFCTKVQFVGFLIFLNCQMSPQLRRFLKNIYKFCVGFAQVFGGLHREEYESHLSSRPTPVYERHINFEEHEVFRFFLQNFGLIFILHALIALAFISLQVFRLCKKLTNQNLEGTPELLLKGFNLNTLLWFFFFQLPIYVFCLLNLKYMTFSGHSLFVASTIITIFYIIFFTLALTALVLSLIKFRKFSESQPDLSKSSSAFFSLSYYISGYRPIPKAYFFDAVYILFYLTHSIFLVFLYKWPSLHVMSAAMLLLGLLLALFMIRPFLKKGDFIMEAGWGCVMFLVYVALAFMSYLDLDNQQALDERKIIGWVVLCLLFVALLIYFIYVVWYFVKFIRESVISGVDNTSTHMMEGMNTPNRTQKVYAQRDDNQMMGQNDDASDNYSNSAFQRKPGYRTSNLDSDSYGKGDAMGSSHFRKPQMAYNAPPQFNPKIKENSEGKFGSLGNLSKMSPHKMHPNHTNTPMQPSKYKPDPSDDYSMTEDDQERNMNKKWDEIKKRTNLTPEEKKGSERHVKPSLQEPGVNPKFHYLEELDQANKRAHAL